MKINFFSVLIVTVTCLLVSFFSVSHSLAGMATFQITILVEDGFSGKPVSNAKVGTSHPRGIVGLMNSGLTNERGEVSFNSDFGYFSPRGSGNFPEIGTEGISVDITVTREGYRPYSGSGMFHIRNQGPAIIRLQPEHSRHTAPLHGSYPTPFPGTQVGGLGTKNFTEQPITGELLIISEPVGATVKINDEKAENKTPLAINIQAGSHKIELVLGETAIAREVVVPVGGNVIFQVVFEVAEKTSVDQDKPVFQIK